MNERIRTLLIQAQDLARTEVENDPDIKPPYHIPATQVHKGLGLSYEKFAELIIRECVQVIQDKNDIENYLDSWDHGFVAGLATAIDAIEQHFGVE